MRCTLGEDNELRKPHINSQPAGYPHRSDTGYLNVGAPQDSVSARKEPKAGDSLSYT